MASWTKRTRPSSLSGAEAALAALAARVDESPWTVTAIQRQVRNRGERVNVFLDGEFAFSLGAEVAGGLQEGQRLDLPAIRDLLADDLAGRAYERALRFLAPRPRSVAEVRRHLTRHGFTPEAVDAAIDRLIDRGYLDDQAFARYWISQRQAFSPRGARALRAELRQKGIDTDTLSAALAPLETEQEDAAMRAGLKYARRAPLDERAFSQSVSAFLLRRGFDYGTVRSAVRRLWEARCFGSSGAE